MNFLEDRLLQLHDTGGYAKLSLDQACQSHPHHQRGAIVAQPSSVTCFSMTCFFMRHKHPAWTFAACATVFELPHFRSKCLQVQFVHSLALRSLVSERTREQYKDTDE